MNKYAQLVDKAATVECREAEQRSSAHQVRRPSLGPGTNR